MCSISQSKEQLWGFKLQGRYILNVCSSFLYYFSIEQTLHLPEFVEWCVSNYSPTERVIMKKNTTRILCQVNAKVVREVLNVPKNFPGNPEVFSEEPWFNCIGSVSLKS